MHVCAVFFWAPQKNAVLRCQWRWSVEDHSGGCCWESSLQKQHLVYRYQQLAKVPFSRQIYFKMLPDFRNHGRVVFADIDAVSARRIFCWDNVSGSFVFWIHLQLEYQLLIDDFTGGGSFFLSPNLMLTRHNLMFSKSTRHEALPASAWRPGSCHRDGVAGRA